MISYDWDTSPTQKSMESSFYGYVPDAALSRAACFFSTMALSFAHVMLQTFSCALLAVTNPWWLLYYFAADFGFSFLFKTARSDLLYILNLNDLVIMINLTLLFQMRHPQEAGGFLCLSSLLFSVAGNFVSAYLYLTYYKGWGDELVKRWTLESWDRWGSEKPSWFTEACVNHVPNEYVPYDWRVKYKKTNGRVNDAQLKKRRGSVSVRELLGGKEDR
ncbi:hypothetical protein TrLO_g587 [Triparma laevis f. longispina]|uniref:Uncharacterized protein n=1 Tax=Triparma laevis f. longispina TaxID=1714387 RepID=A0A9W7A6I4_9STRA|nr:hypothetical protein TrLO_g587 [Triparma laevis f. longispina]